MKEKESCKIEIQRQFLFWKWVATKDNHKWFYTGTKTRKCTKCKRPEISVHTYINSIGIAVEDWVSGSW